MGLEHDPVGDSLGGVGGIMGLIEERHGAGAEMGTCGGGAGNRETDVGDCDYGKNSNSGKSFNSVITGH